MFTARASSAIGFRPARPRAFGTRPDDCNRARRAHLHRTFCRRRTLDVFAHRTAREPTPTGRRLGVMDLPMAPSYALDEAGLRSQLERYRQAGQNARLIERTPHSLVVDLDEDVDAELVAETVAIERECCPFFALSWEPDRRRLTISVSQSAHEPTIDAIAFALDLQVSD